MLARQEWIKGCQFQNQSNQEVFDILFKRIKDLEAEFRAGRGPHPVVLFDLDSTLYEVGPRTHAILKEWALSPEANEFPKLQPIFANLKPEDVGYSIRDTFRALGLNERDPILHVAFEHIKNFWSHRFFSNHYLHYDVAYEGAVQFVQKIYDLGAEIIYLTGRDEPRMGEGTRKRLIQDGFPFERKRTELVMKAAAHIDDKAHKQEVAERIRSHGRLVASFENEPANVVAIQEVFPAAMNVFVDTVCSDHPAPVRKNLYRITGFQLNVG
jgi:hypothetical protein